MRKIVLLVTALLVISGLGLTFYELMVLPPEWRKALALLHIWGGVFFLVIFSLFAWDHISTNRGRLRRFTPVSLTGVLQTLAAVVITLTGVVLLLYGNLAWPALRGFHYWLTYILAASIFFHYLSPKE